MAPGRPAGAGGSARDAQLWPHAAEALASLPAPVNAVPGNHDNDVEFTVGMGRADVGTSRAMVAGDWLHLFVDSNRGVMVEAADGRLVDPDGGERLHRNGALGSAESAG